MYEGKKEKSGSWKCYQDENVFIEDLIQTVNEAYRSIPAVTGTSGPDQKKIIVKIIADCNGASGILERLKLEDKKYTHIRWIYFYFASDFDELSIAGAEGGKFTGDLLQDEFRSCDEL